MNKIKPTGLNVLIEIFDCRDESRGGVSLIVTNQDPLLPDRGICIEKSDAIDVISVGDKILFEKYQGVKLEEDGRKFVLIDLRYCQAILPEDSDITIRKEKQLY